MAWLVTAVLVDAGAGAGAAALGVGRDQGAHIATVLASRYGPTLPLDLLEWPICETSEGKYRQYLTVRCAKANSPPLGCRAEAVSIGLIDVVIMLPTGMLALANTMPFNTGFASPFLSVDEHGAGSSRIWTL